MLMIKNIREIITSVCYDFKWKKLGKSEIRKLANKNNIKLIETRVLLILRILIFMVLLNIRIQGYRNSWSLALQK